MNKTKFQKKWEDKIISDNFINENIHMEYWDKLFEKIVLLDAPFMESGPILTKEDLLPDYALKIDDYINEDDRYLKIDNIMSKILSLGISAAREEKEKSNEKSVEREETFIDLAKYIINARLKYYISELRELKKDIKYRKEVELFITKQNEYYYRDELINKIVDEINEMTDTSKDTMISVIHRGLFLYTSRYHVNTQSQIIGTNGKNLFNLEDGVFSNTKMLFNEYLNAMHKTMKKRDYSQVNIEKEIFGLYEKIKDYSLNEEFIKLEYVKDVVKSQNIENINKYLEDGSLLHFVKKDVEKLQNENGETIYSIMYSIPEYLTVNNLRKNNNEYLKKLFGSKLSYESKNNILTRLSLKSSYPSYPNVTNHHEIYFGYRVKEGYQDFVTYEIEKMIHTFLEQTRNYSLVNDISEISEGFNLEALEREAFLRKEMQETKTNAVRKKI